MKVHHAFPAIASLVVLAAGVPAAAAPRLETMLPAETRMVILVKDVSDVRAAWPVSPLGRLWNDPEFREGAIAEDSSRVSPWGRIHRATGMSVHEILNAFEDQAAVCIPDLESLFSPAGSWAVVATAPDDGPLRTLADRIAGSGGSDDADVSWKWENGVGFLGSPPSYIETLVAAQSSTGSHLNEVPDWNDLQAEAHDLRLFLDLRGVADLLTTLLARSEPADSSAAQFLGITPESVVGALGLEALHAFGVGARLESDGTRVDAGLLMEDAPGIPRLLALEPGPCGRPAAIPADAVYASVTRFRLAVFWTSFLEMMDRIQPGMSSLIAFQVGAMTQASGLDFENDFLEEFGDEMFSAYLPPKSPEGAGPAWGGFDQLTGITVKDPGKMETSFEWLLAGSPAGQEGQSETREIDGIPIHTIRFGEEPRIPSFSYAFFESTLLVSGGDPDVPARAIAAARKPHGSLWDRPDLASLLALVPPEAAQITFCDPRSLRGMKWPTPSGDATGKEDASDRPTARRKAAVMAAGRHLGPILGYVVKAPSGLRGQAWITAPGP